MASWREHARKTWEWWQHFDAAQGLVGFLQRWAWLFVLAGTWGVAVVGIVIAALLFAFHVLTASWFVTVTVTAILIATMPNVILFWVGMRPPRPAEARSSPEATLGERGQIVVTEPAPAPEEEAIPVHPPSRSDKMEDGEATVEDASATGQEVPGDRVFVQRGEWHEVYWQAWRLWNGYIDVEGPYCPRDFEMLRFYDGNREAGVEDYQEVRPPATYLICPKCKHKYYLGATQREAKRIGDSRSYAGWRLDGGKTRAERLRDVMGL